MPDLLFQAVSAGGNTALDLLLTQFANQVADAFEQQTAPPADDGDGDGDGGDGDGGDGNGDGDGGGPLTGDPVAGQQTFAATGCTACHGDNGEGGIGPALFGNDELAALEMRFGSGATHNGLTLTEQDIADVAAWLLGDTDGGGGGGDASAGADTFAADCASCHGADGASGFAPDISGFDVAALNDGLALGVHGAISLTDTDVANIAAFLGG